MLRTLKKKRKKYQGQIMIEFTFSMIVALIMIFSTLMIFRWSGADLGWRRVDHDLKFTNVVVEDWLVTGSCIMPSRNPDANKACAHDQVHEGPLEQIDPYFHKPLKMDAAWGL